MAGRRPVSTRRSPPPAPRVRWRRGDRARTPDADALRRMAQGALDETWRGLPGCVRFVIDRFASHYVMLVNVTKDLPRDDPKWDEFFDGLAHCEGRVTYEGKLVVLNLACFRRTKRDRAQIVWTLAHEFAHGFEGRMRLLAWFGFTYHKEGKWEEDHVYRRRGFRPKEEIVEHAIRWGGGAEAEPDEAPLHERVADALALAWGFVPERGTSYLPVSVERLGAAEEPKTKVRTRKAKGKARRKAVAEKSKRDKAAQIRKKGDAR